MNRQETGAKGKEGRKAAGKSFIPKTAAGRARQLEKIERQRERMQRQIASVKKREAELAAAVRADRERVKAGLERAAGRMLLSIIAEKQALGERGDAKAGDNAAYWMGQLDRAVTEPAAREMAGLPPKADLQGNPEDRP